MSGQQQQQQQQTSSSSFAALHDGVDYALDTNHGNFSGSGQQQQQHANAAAPTPAAGGGATRTSSSTTYFPLGELRNASSFPYAAFPPESSNNNRTTPRTPIHEALTAEELFKLRSWLARLPPPPNQDPYNPPPSSIQHQHAVDNHSSKSYSYEQLNDSNNNTNPPSPLQYHAGATKSSSYDVAAEYQTVIRPSLSGATSSVNSDYPVYQHSTHAWAIFANAPKKRAGILDRLVGLLIISFQIFTYYLFAAEAIEDFIEGRVPVTIGHQDCTATDETPTTTDMLVCEAGRTHDLDAFVAFFMLGIFLAGDFIQAFTVMTMPEVRGNGLQFMFALLAVIEVVAAYLAATMAVAYHLYVGEATDAVEVGVGLLFIRELSQRTYSGLRDASGLGSGGSNNKQYKAFFGVVLILVVFGMTMNHVCEFLFAKKD